MQSENERGDIVEYQLVAKNVEVSFEQKANAPFHG